MQRYTSAATSINSSKAPAIYGMPKAVDIMRGKRVIDIGGGRYDTAVFKASEYGATVSIYDKYNRTAEHNTDVLSGSYDVAVISNVLNVIDNANDRRDVIELAAHKAQTILITVYEGNGTGIGCQTGSDSWQENRKLSDYIDEIKEAIPAWDVQKMGRVIICKK